MSKQNRKRYQGQQRDQETQENKKILEECKGLKKLRTSRKKKILICNLSDVQDEIEASRKGTANTFTNFYSDIDSDERPEGNKKHDEDDATTKSDDSAGHQELNEL